MSWTNFPHIFLGNENNSKDLIDLGNTQPCNKEMYSEESCFDSLSNNSFGSQNSMFQNSNLDKSKYNLTGLLYDSNPKAFNQKPLKNTLTKNVCDSHIRNNFVFKNSANKTVQENYNKETLIEKQFKNQQKIPFFSNNFNTNKNEYSWKDNSLFEIRPIMKRKKSCDLGNRTKKSSFLKVPIHKRFKLNKLKFKNKTNKKKTKKRHKKIFHPREYFAKINFPEIGKDFQEKLKMFMFLPQFLCMTQMNLAKKIKVPESQISHKKNQTKKLGNSWEIKTNTSLITLPNEKPIHRLTENQKVKKISKKFKRAWNLNQKLPINVFKKQVCLSEDHFKAATPQEAENGFLSDNKFDCEHYSRQSSKIVKLIPQIKLQRQSKLKAKNKIENSMIMKKKKRASSSLGKEQLEYKRLVGLKKEIALLCPKTNNDNENIFNFNSQYGQKLACFDNFLTPIKNIEKRKYVDNKNDFHYFDFKNDLNKSASTLGSKVLGLSFEFLDFSLKNINKTNFSSLNNK